MPPPRGDSSENTPPTAAARSASTSRPPPGCDRRAADAVVAALDRQLVAAVGGAQRALGGVGVARSRWRSPRPPAGTPSSRSSPAKRRPGSSRRCTGSGARAARTCSAAASPRSESTAGCRPRASSPIAALASIASASTSASSASSGEPGIARPQATRSFSASATTCWCAPSCSARSSRRRASSPASTRRARDSASSARASALASAWASRPQSPTSRRSQPGGSASSSARRRDQHAPRLAVAQDRRGDRDAAARPCSAAPGARPWDARRR